MSESIPHEKSSLSLDDEATSSENGGKKIQTFCLFLGDLSYFCSEQDLRDAFEPFGTITDIRIIRNKATKKSLSYGFVDFHHAISATNAMREMQGKLVCGRAIK